MYIIISYPQGKGLPRGRPIEQIKRLIVCQKIAALRCKRFSRILLQRQTVGQMVLPAIAITQHSRHPSAQIGSVGVFLQIGGRENSETGTTVERDIPPRLHLVAPLQQLFFQTSRRAKRIAGIDKKRQPSAVIVGKGRNEHQFAQRLKRTVAMPIGQQRIDLLSVEEGQRQQLFTVCRIQIERLGVPLFQPLRELRILHLVVLLRNAVNILLDKIVPRHVFLPLHPHVLRRQCRRTDKKKQADQGRTSAENEGRAFHKKNSEHRCGKGTTIYPSAKRNETTRTGNGKTLSA